MVGNLSAGQSAENSTPVDALCLLLFFFFTLTTIVAACSSDIIKKATHRLALCISTTSAFYLSSPSQDVDEMESETSTTVRSWKLFPVSVLLGYHERCFASGESEPQGPPSGPPLFAKRCWQLSFHLTAAVPSSLVLNSCICF